MYRALKLTAAAVAISAVFAGAAYAAMRPVPENLPEAVLQNTTEAQLPGDAAALEEALKRTDPVRYKILVIDSADEEDKTDYLDRVAEQWGLPGADTLYLIIYTKDNYDIRFYMGADFRSANVSVDEMLGLVRTHYLAGKRGGDVAGALADLIGAVNQRMSEPAAAGAAVGQEPGAGAGQGADPDAGSGADHGAASATYTVPNPFAAEGRRTAVEELELAKGLLTPYFTDMKAASLPDNQRLLDSRWTDAQIHTVEAEESRIVYEISYDVLPAAGADSAWAARGGETGTDGWVVGIHQYMTVVKEGDLWRLDGFSTER